MGLKDNDDFDFVLFVPFNFDFYTWSLKWVFVSTTVVTLVKKLL